MSKLTIKFKKNQWVVTTASGKILRTTDCLQRAQQIVKSYTAR